MHPPRGFCSLALLTCLAGTAVAADSKPILYWDMGETVVGRKNAETIAVPDQLPNGGSANYALTVQPFEAPGGQLGPIYTKDAAPGSDVAVQITPSINQLISQAEPVHLKDDDYVFELWYKPAETEQRSIFYNGDPALNGFGFLQSQAVEGGPVILRALLGGRAYIDGPEMTELVGKWSHLALVVHEGVTSLYVNGEFVGSAQLTPGIAAVDNANGQDGFFIGNRRESEQERASGIFDEIRLFEIRGRFDPTRNLANGHFAK